MKHGLLVVVVALGMMGCAEGVEDEIAAPPVPAAQPGRPNRSLSATPVEQPPPTNPAFRTLSGPDFARQIQEKPVINPPRPEQ
jgi:hypothetical protein